MARWDIPDLSSLDSDAPVTDPREESVLGDTRTTSMYLGDTEIDLFDTWAQEVPEISGAKALMYVLDASQSTIDPLYREPIALSYRGPFELTISLTLPEMAVSPREEGRFVEGSVTIWVARKEIERAVGNYFPKEGDIFHIWDIPIIRDRASAFKQSTKGGYYFEAIAVTDDGHLFSGPAFVGYSMECRRSTTYPAEQQLCCGTETTDSREPC